MEQLTQKQAKQNAIKAIKKFNKELTNIYGNIPMGNIYEIIWSIYILELKRKCNETVQNIKHSINENNENNTI